MNQSTKNLVVYHTQMQYTQSASNTSKLNASNEIREKAEIFLSVSYVWFSAIFYIRHKTHCALKIDWSYMYACDMNLNFE